MFDMFDIIENILRNSSSEIVALELLIMGILFILVVWKRINRKL